MLLHRAECHDPRLPRPGPGQPRSCTEGAEPSELPGARSRLGQPFAPPEPGGSWTFPGTGLIEVLQTTSFLGHSFKYRRCWKCRGATRHQRPPWNKCSKHQQASRGGSTRPKGVRPVTVRRPRGPPGRAPPASPARSTQMRVPAQEEPVASTGPGSRGAEAPSCVCGSDTRTSAALRTHMLRSGNHDSGGLN